MSEHKERKTLEERHQMSDLERLRHSCAHVLATAICRLWPDAQLAGGPAVDNGFYYDVELDHRISTEDFERIEEEMKKVVKENQPFQKEVISRAEAMKMAESGELGALGPRNTSSQFKIDLLNDIPEDEEISLYRNGDFTDLCAGPHVGRTGNCKAFKIMSVASAFYKGDKNRPMLQRIYGTCFPNRIQLDEHLERLEEAGVVHKVNTESGAFYLYCSHGEGRRDCFLLKCQRCGRIRHVDCTRLQNLYDHLEREHHFRIDPRGTLFSGVCDVCAGEEDHHGAQ